MATTATINITSADLLPGGSLGISANTNLTKAGITTDIDQKLSGVVKVTVGGPTEHRLGPLATEMAGDAHDIASYLYIANLTTGSEIKQGAEYGHVKKGSATLLGISNKGEAMNFRLSSMPNGVLQFLAEVADPDGTEKNTRNHG